MTKLYKLDLEPNEIYNVSLNIKQGNKTVDNLRFFQTKVPKLFNLKPSNFSTFSQITEVSDAIATKVLNSGFSTGGDEDVSVTGINWIRYIEKYERSEGETVIDPSSVKYEFTLNFASDPKLIGYVVSGFPKDYDFLNYRTSYQAGANNTLTLVLSLLEIDPTVTRELKNTTKNYTATISNEIIKGSTTRLEFTRKLKGIVVGKTLGFVELYSTSSGGTKYVFDNAVVTGYGSYTKDNGAKRWWVSLSSPALSSKPANSTFYYSTATSEITFSGGVYDRLGQASKGYDPKKPVYITTGLGSSKITYQTFPSYDAKKAVTEYTFKKSSFISSSVINPNVLEKLIWEDEVRDYIYFIISDTDKEGGDGKKYFFGTHGSITKISNETEPLEGSIIFNPKAPPAANGYIVETNNKIFKNSTGKVKYYQAAETTTNNQTAPPLLRTVTVQFAVARYRKEDTGWKGSWLPSETSSPADILSSPEELE